jgi:hypothetical protein
MADIPVIDPVTEEELARHLRFVKWRALKQSLDPFIEAMR